MEQKNKDVLKKGLMETNLDFTSKLMDKIEAEEKAMSQVLSKGAGLEPSELFTTSLMSKLEGKVPTEPYRPVISKSAWIGIAVVFAVLILIASLGTGQETDLKYSVEIDPLTDGISSIFQYSQAIMYTSCGILILTLGLLFEQRLKKERK